MFQLPESDFGLWQRRLSGSSVFTLKGTLIQISKSPYMFVFIKNTILWKICILNPNSSWVICPWSLKFLKNYANFQYILLFLNVCKQTFDTSHVRISQQVKGVLMWNLQHIIFISRQIYWQIFKSAFSVPFKDQDQCLITLLCKTLSIAIKLRKFTQNRINGK